MALAGELVGPKGLVVGIDWQDEIVEHVQSCLDLYPEQLAHVSVERSEDVTIGLEHRKPWDVIIMNGSIPQIPTDVIHQLRDENGRLLFFCRWNGLLDVPGRSSKSRHSQRRIIEPISLLLHWSVAMVLGRLRACQKSLQWDPPS